MELKTKNSELKTCAAGAPRQDRDEDSYVIDAGLKLLVVLGCLEGRSCEPVSIKRAMQRSGFNRDLTRRLLITLKKGGWAKEVINGREREFTLGPKAESVARTLSQQLLKSEGFSDPQTADRT